VARSNYLARPGETEAAAGLGRACFRLAELTRNEQRRTSLAEEGMSAARFASQNDPNNAEGWFFLALNQGELARDKGLGALSWLRQMEKALLRASELDPHLDHAGPDRSLGELYRDAPAWPISIGNKWKAREHLERAVRLEPDYPDNQLSLLEAYAHWKETAHLRDGVERYRKLLPEMQKKYSGSQWAQPLQDWDRRWAAVLDQIKED
jgi:tetratricopeptide (TPR) repeat protein